MQSPVAPAVHLYSYLCCGAPSAPSPEASSATAATATAAPNSVVALLSRGTKRVLVAALRACCSVSDLEHLNLSSMAKSDLRRHLAAAARAGGGAAVVLALSPYSACSDDVLLQIVLRRKLISTHRLTRQQLLAMLHFHPNANKTAELDRVFLSQRAESNRRSVTEQCLRAMEAQSNSLGPARVEVEARRLLAWTSHDGGAHSPDTVGILLHRVCWLRQWRGLGESSAKDAANYLVRHVIPFLLCRPDLMMSNHACWETLQMESAMPNVAVVTKKTANPQRRPLFFLLQHQHASLQTWLDSGKLREPQRLALIALRESFSNATPAVDSSANDEGPLKALMTLRRWFVAFLRASYTSSASQDDNNDNDESAEDEEEDQTSSSSSSSSSSRRDLVDILASFAANSSTAATTTGAKLVVLPTGVGKSRVICLAPLALSSPPRRVLVLCPSLEIRSQMAFSFVSLYNDCAERSLSPIKVMELVDSSSAINHLESCDVCVCTVHQMVGDRLVTCYPRDCFDLVLIDEAHHAECLSYRVVRDHFHRALFMYFTGTPYRTDHRPLQADLVYSCTMKEALQREDPYIKRLCYLPLAVQSLTISDPATQEQVIELSSFEAVVNYAASTPRASQLLARVLRHSLEARSHVIGLVIRTVKSMRAVSGVYHQAILQASDTTEAEFLVSLWNAHPENTGLSIASVHSQMSRSQCDAVIDRLRKSTLDAIVHVGMLGEGFDHPRLSVCGIFRRFASMPPFVQLVGRILRRIVGDGVGAQDNVGYVIAHPGLGLDTLWKAYQSESWDTAGFDSYSSTNTTSLESDWLDLSETYSYAEEHPTWFI